MAAREADAVLMTAVMLYCAQVSHREKICLSVFKVLLRRRDLAQSRSPVLLYPVSLPVLYMSVSSSTQRMVTLVMINMTYGIISEKQGTTDGVLCCSPIEVNRGRKPRRSSMDIFRVFAEMRIRFPRNASEERHYCANCVSCEDR